MHNIGGAFLGPQYAPMAFSGISDNANARANIAIGYLEPENPVALVYDALVLANVPRAVHSDEVLDWIDERIAKRGSLLMAGGPWSFGGGDRTGTVVEQLLPVEYGNAPD